MSTGSTSAISGVRCGASSSASTQAAPPATRPTGQAGAVYAIPSVVRDAKGNLWVFWGTGDRVDVTGTTAANNFYAVKDADAASPRVLADLIPIASGTYTDSDTRKGWYVSLAGTGEKVLSDSTVFHGVVYFTSFTPDAGGPAPAAPAERGFSTGSILSGARESCQAGRKARAWAEASLRHRCYPTIPARTSRTFS
jgi:hypothetical protein